MRGPISSWSWKADATDGRELAGGSLQLEDGGCGHGEHFPKLRDFFAVFDAVGENAQSKGFDVGYGGRSIRSVRHDADKVGNFRQPAPIVFPVNLDSQSCSSSSPKVID